MSTGAGIVQGFADSMNMAETRKQRNRELSVMEMMAKQGGPGGATPTAPLAAAAAGAPVPTGAGTGIAPTERASYAYDYFLKKGLPEHVSAGLVGNLMQESGEGLNTGAVGDGGNAFGAAQWNGPRRHAYMSYAQGRSVDPTNLDAQLDYILEEGRTTEKSAWGAIMATKTPEEAALVASQKFWRPGDPRNENRTRYAASIYGARRPAPAPTAPATAPAAPAAAAPAARWGFFNKFIEGDDA